MLTYLLVRLADAYSMIIFIYVCLLYTSDAADE